MSDEATKRLSEALAERDRALQQLAEVRAELDALKLALRNEGEPVPPQYPPGVNPAAAPPLRYVVADRVNGWLRPVRSLLSRRR